MAAECRAPRPRWRATRALLAFEAGRRWGVPREHGVRRPVRLARRERDRHHRQDGGVRRQERTSHRPPGWRRKSARRPPSSAPARERHHRHHGIRGQGIPHDGDGGGRREP